MNKILNELFHYSDKILFVIVPIIFYVLNFPQIYIVVSPIVIIVYGIWVDKYEKRNERMIENLIGKAKKLRSLTKSLERILIIGIGTSVLGLATALLDYGLLEDELATKGWRNYFGEYGNCVTEEFNQLTKELEICIEKPESLDKNKLDELNRKFYRIVSEHHTLYREFDYMVKKVDGLPENFQDRYYNFKNEYENFIRGLNRLSDEEEDIRELFKGKVMLDIPKELEIKRTEPLRK